MKENEIKNNYVRDAAWGGGSESLRQLIPEPRPDSLCVRAKLEVLEYGERA